MGISKAVKQNFNKLLKKLLYQNIKFYAGTLIKKYVVFRKNGTKRRMHRGPENT